MLYSSLNSSLFPYGNALLKTVPQGQRDIEEIIFKICWEFYMDTLHTVYSSDNSEWTVMTQDCNFVIQTGIYILTSQFNKCQLNCIIKLDITLNSGFRIQFRKIDIGLFIFLGKYDFMVLPLKIKAICNNEHINDEHINA